MSDFERCVLIVGIALLLLLSHAVQREQIDKLKAEIQTNSRSTCNCPAPTGSTLTNDVIRGYIAPDNRRYNQNAKIIATNILSEAQMIRRAEPTWFFSFTNDETNGPEFASKREGNRTTGEYRIDYSTNYAK